MHPADQRLDTRQFAAARKVDLWLVVKDDFFFVECSTKLSEQRDLFVILAVPFIAVEDERVALALC